MRLNLTNETNVRMVINTLEYKYFNKNLFPRIFMEG